MKLFAWMTAGVIVLTMMSGCGGKPSPEPVSGTITYNGEPVVNANVIFTPKTAEGEVARGQTDDQGKVTQVSTASPGDGVRPGEYAVSLTPLAPASSSGDEIDYAAAPQKPPFPEKYMDPSVTDLRVTVAPGSDNQFNLELKD
jgi:hypothetical protein